MVNKEGKIKPKGDGTKPPGEKHWGLRLTYARPLMQS